MKCGVKGALRAASVPVLAYGGWWFLAHGRAGHPRLRTLRAFRYAHRGLYDNEAGIPENSLAAFRRAAEHGFGVELDVHLTKDGRLAVVHDSNLQRMCGLDARVEELSSEQLSRLRLLGTDEQIPYLDDVLPFFADTTAVIVEIKPENGNHNRLTAATMDCLDRFHGVYCVESFDPRVPLWLRRHRPDVVRGQLAQNMLGSAAEPGLPLILRFALTALLCNVGSRPDFVAEKFSDRRNPSHWLCCHRWGVQGVYWTIQSPEEQAVADADDHIVIFENYVPDPSTLSGAGH